MISRIKIKNPTIIALVFAALLQACHSNSKTSDGSNNQNIIPIDLTSNQKKCLGKNPILNYFVEGYGSEEAEADIYFKNDTILDKIHFSIASSMNLIEHLQLARASRSCPT
jgi:hypothetical protein